MGTLYENIKALCDERGISPAEFNRQVGLPRNFMSELKAGRKQTIRATTAQKIADYFGVNVDKIINGGEIIPVEISVARQELIELVKNMDEEQVIKWLELIRTIKNK